MERRDEEKFFTINEVHLRIFLRYSHLHDILMRNAFPLELLPGGYRVAAPVLIRGENAIWAR